MVEQHDQIRVGFGLDGNGGAVRTTGWSVAEPGETWTDGHDSQLVLPAPQTPGPYALSLKLRPMLAPPALVAQRVVVRVNGAEVGHFTVAARTQRACIVPWSLIEGRRTLDITLHLPDAARPSDTGVNPRDRRQLGVALASLMLYRLAPPCADLPASQRDGAAVADLDAIQRHDLLMRFESLGQNCEFGLVQRQCQAEPLGLLRFSSTPLPQLLNALDAGFEGMGGPDTIEVLPSANGREYMVSERTYGFLYHAWVNIGEMDPAEVAKREMRRVPFLVRKLLEDLQSGEKIFVFKRQDEEPDEAEVYALALALRRYGPNTLLYVTLADDQHPGGTVLARAPGFLVGYIDRFAPGENAHDLLLDQWVALCVGAAKLRLAAE